MVILGILAFVLAGRIANEMTLLAASGPDSLATLLRELVGRDTIVIGGQTIAVADVARELQTRMLASCHRRATPSTSAPRSDRSLLEALLALIVTFYFLVDGPMLWHRTIEVLPFRHRDRTVELLGRIHDVARQVAPRPDRPDRPRGVRDVHRPRTDPPPPYALGIAILTGLLEIIPLIGPLIATAIAAIDAFAHGGAPAVADRDRDLLRDPPGRGPGRDAAGHRAGRPSPPGRHDLRGPRRA